MEDREIIALFFARSEEAIRAADGKYGGYCKAVAGRILADEQDREECVNDVWLSAWNSIPPQRPDSLKAYLGRLARNLALNRLTRASAQKRGGGQVPLALEELSECVSAPGGPEEAAEAASLTEALDSFLDTLGTSHRRIFLQRYWYFCSVSEIARDLGMGESGVKMSLSRSRKKLKAYLQKGGFLFE